MTPELFKTGLVTGILLGIYKKIDIGLDLNPTSLIIQLVKTMNIEPFNWKFILLLISTSSMLISYGIISYLIYELFIRRNINPILLYTAGGIFAFGITYAIMTYLHG
jgi:hypothetical protein